MARGTISDRYHYDAFGTSVHEEGLTFNHRYCGEQFDGALGLYSLRARLMDAAKGRFWTADVYEGTAEDPTSLHKYLYCGADLCFRLIRVVIQVPRNKRSYRE
jgi:RHS repeat-associated protein